MSSFNWTCPHCERAQTVTATKQHLIQEGFSTGGTTDGQLGIRALAIACSNSECGKTTINVWVGPFHRNTAGYLVSQQNGSPLFFRRIVPEGGAKVLPDYIPLAIRTDYKEACLIKDLSPKASATLARRCLQGMIRHFAKVKPGTLFNEIGALEVAVQDGTAPRGVSEDSIGALTAVRKVGNIGAHMESDVDVIVDVDSGEAQTLIDLIESLIDDWYVESHKRQARFASAVALGHEKTLQLSEARKKALPAPNKASETGD